MKKIDKLTNRFAQKYFNDKKKPSAYNSSHYKYYNDVLCNLLICQNGLCAYSELRLISEAKLAKLQLLLIEENITQRPECPADIEHFDRKLTATDGWNWDNLFAVFDSLNQKIKARREKELEKETGSFVDYILKPDLETYNPNALLFYNREEHIFIANPNLSEIEAINVEKMIYVLGINYDFIKMQRKAFVEDKIYQKNPEINQFFTAFEMSKKQILQGLL